jgi:uncharacterized protein DUF4238
MFFGHYAKMPLDHYVSQVHLRNFYSPALGDRMYATRKSDLKSFSPNSQSVCRIPDNSTNSYLREDRAIEKFLKMIEPAYNASVTKLVDDKVDRECIFAISGFVAYVLTCSPTAMRIGTVPMRSMVETLAIEEEKCGSLPLPPKELGGRDLADLLSAGDIKIEVDPKYPQAIGIASIMKHVAAFGNFKWEILVNNDGQNPFFTSDFPVTVERSEDPRIVNRIVPLAPHLAVRIRPDIRIDRKRANFTFANFGYRRKKIRRNELVEINRMIVRGAEDSVFYRDDYSWIPKFIERNRNYRTESVVQKLPTNDGVFVISTQRIVRHNYQDAERQNLESRAKKSRAALGPSP